jgi:hypothetical protein
VWSAIVSEGGSKGANRVEAHLDVVLPRHVSVGMRSYAIHDNGLPLGRGRRVVGRAGPLAVLHLDGVKRWGHDCSGFEPHQSSRSDVGVEQRGARSAPIKS